ncbi:MAG: cadmium-containing carbonic anhydrase [Candidatus Gottesmanbacteria bacterium]
MTQPTTKESRSAEQFLMPANPKKIRCVDERVADTAKHDGIAVPGGTEGIIDTIKFLKQVDEETAWKFAVDAGIPMGGHIDEHHGSKGCGYRKLVETEPETVLAVESVAAETRKATLENAHGEITTLLGDHQPTEAIINYCEGTTIDTKKAIGENRGIFDLDAWALSDMAEKLGIEKTEFVSHMTDVYKKTVTKLTGITTFAEIR